MGNSLRAASADFVRSSATAHGAAVARHRAHGPALVDEMSDTVVFAADWPEYGRHPAPASALHAGWTVAGLPMASTTAGGRRALLEPPAPNDSDESVAEDGAGPGPQTATGREVEFFGSCLRSARRSA